MKKSNLLIAGVSLVILGVAGYFVYKAVSNKPKSDADKKKLGTKPAGAGAEPDKVGESDEVVSGTNIGGDVASEPVVVPDAPQVIARQFSVIRKKATSVSPIVKRIAKSGMKYSILDTEVVAGYKWYKVKDGDTEGYIRSDQVNQI